MIDSVWHGETKNGRKVRYWRVWANVGGYRVFRKKKDAIMFSMKQHPETPVVQHGIDSEHILIKALQNIESFSALSAPGTILEQINVFASKALFDVGELEEKEQCDICGDHHEPDNIPRECETGDGF